MNITEFRKRIEKLSREEILQLIREQDPNLVKQINRIEWVFQNKLRHLTWSDGSPVKERDLSKRELALIVDPPFQQDNSLSEAGLTIAQQREAHIASDPVLWAKHYLKAKPRVYQILMLRDPKNRKILRAGRRLGKTYTLALLLLHHSYINKNGRVLVMAPMKSHVQLVYEEAIRLAQQSEIVYNSITRSITSPQYEIYWSNGSTVKFFTTGMRSGGKADVARGQEAHIIILDEMDYMGQDDLDALYAMLQRTDENQPDKLLIGASTPTGRRERFWEWSRSDRFREFWFPSYCNPMWDRAMEEEMREEYTEMGYRHEIEADCGEDVEGVYPRRYVDRSFLVPGWDYVEARTSARSFHLMGVDWDKYGAGPNIVVLEVCSDDHEDERLRGKVRVAFREEIPRSEYVLTKTVDRVIELNKIFNPKFIYVDRGYGDTQVELLHKHGVEHPGSGLKTKVKGVSFSETLEVRDPASKQRVKKELKPFMVDNLRTLLEREEILFPEHDDELYLQLISYVVVRTTTAGRPVFEASGSQADHAHDALILACLAYTQNYGELHRVNIARKAAAISNKKFAPFYMPDESKADDDEDDDEETVPKMKRRSGVPRRRRGSAGRPISRSKF